MADKKASDRDTIDVHSGLSPTEFDPDAKKKPDTDKWLHRHMAEVRFCEGVPTSYLLKHGPLGLQKLIEKYRKLREQVKKQKL